jgi:hypothetical protein
VSPHLMRSGRAGGKSVPLPKPSQSVHCEGLTSAAEPRARAAYGPRTALLARSRGPSGLPLTHVQRLYSVDPCDSARSTSVTFVTRWW